MMCLCQPCLKGFVFTPSLLLCSQACRSKLLPRGDPRYCEAIATQLTSDDTNANSANTSLDVATRECSDFSFHVSVLD